MPQKFNNMYFNNWDAKLNYSDYYDFTLSSDYNGFKDINSYSNNKLIELNLRNFQTEYFVNKLDVITFGDIVYYYDTDNKRKCFFDKCLPVSNSKPNTDFYLISGDTIASGRNEEYYQYTILSGDTELQKFVYDNNILTMAINSGDVFDYTIEQAVDGIAFKGGYYSGYFKLHGYQYKFMETRAINGYTMNFELKPYSLDITGTVNDLFPENKGLLFYYGLKKEYLKEVLPKVPEESSFIFWNRSGENCSRKVILPDYGRTISGDVNPFLYYARTSGFCEDEYSQVIENMPPEIYKSNVCNAAGNSFGIFINDDNTLTYRVTRLKVPGDFNRPELDCEVDEIEVLNFTSIKTAVSKDVYQNLTLVFDFKNEISCDMDICDILELPPRYGKLKIYNNGVLIEIINNVLEVKPRELPLSENVQLGYPYNILIGGNNGVLEEISPLEYLLMENALPITKNFSGAYIGELKRITLYNDTLDGYSIKFI